MVIRCYEDLMDRVQSYRILEMTDVIWLFEALADNYYRDNGMAER